MKFNKLFTFIFLSLFLISLASAWYFYPEEEQEKITCPTIEPQVLIMEEVWKLEQTLSDLRDNITLVNGDCLKYALFYEEILNRDYPKLDVRRIKMAGVCPIGEVICGEDEGTPHTYLIVNGWGGECILDQKKLACIQLRKNG